MTTSRYGDPLSGDPTASETGQGSGAAEQARDVAGTAKDEGAHVASVAEDEAKNVTGEARQQASSLLDEARSQVEDQTRVQRDRLVGTLRTLTDDLERMVSGQGGGQGMAADLARQVADRARELTDALKDREPGELVGQVRRFARQRPGTFLLGALAAGVVAGRFARGAKEANSSDVTDSSPYDDVRGPVPTGLVAPDIAEPRSGLPPGPTTAPPGSLPGGGAVPPAAGPYTGPYSDGVQ